MSNLLYTYYISFVLIEIEFWLYQTLLQNYMSVLSAWFSVLFAKNMILFSSTLLTFQMNLRLSKLKSHLVVSRVLLEKIRSGRFWRQTESNTIRKFCLNVLEKNLVKFMRLNNNFAWDLGLSRLYMHATAAWYWNRFISPVFLSSFLEGLAKRIRIYFHSCFQFNLNHLHPPKFAPTLEFIAPSLMCRNGHRIADIFWAVFFK